MRHELKINEQILPVELRRNAQAKRIILRLKRDGSGLQVTMPKCCSEKKALDFARQQRDWIKRQLAKKKPKVALVDGVELSVLGELLAFHHHDQRGTKQDASTVYIGGDEAFFARRVKDYIRRQAQPYFSELACAMAAEIGKQVASVKLRDTTSRWGSCSQKRNINLSWRLALAPPEVAEYVIAHEVAHLEHFDHSPAFWALVERLMPDYRLHKHWLKAHGAELHAYE